MFLENGHCGCKVPDAGPVLTEKAQAQSGVDAVMKGRQI
jgi:hypothetical protein